MSSRRSFLASLGAAAAGSLLRIDRLAAFAPPLYPPIDLSYFDTPVSRTAADIRFGYAAITWGGQDLQAIEDIAAVGFPGIQLRSNVLKEFGERPAALRDVLAKHHLTLVALSSGGVNIDPAAETRVLDEHTRNARFVHDVGGLYLQVTDQRPKDRAPEILTRPTCADSASCSPRSESGPPIWACRLAITTTWALWARSPTTSIAFWTRPIPAT